MSIDDSRYIHGSDPEEQERLALLNELLNTASLRALRLESGSRVLDLGSGLGQLSRAMARQVTPGGVVVGIEREPRQLAEARRRARLDGEEDLVDFRAGEIKDLPLSDDEWGSFDVAHCRFVLEHLKDPLAAVRMMVRAVRPGGRVVLEDDDHALLRLWPPEPRVERLWRAYAESYEHLGNDPWVGRRLVTLLRDAGAEPRRNDMLFFGGCAGRSTFAAMVTNFAGVLTGARDAIVASSELSAADFDQALDAFHVWSRRGDATLWYATCWAEALKPGASRSRTPVAERPAELAELAEEISLRGERRQSLLSFLAESAGDLSTTLQLDEIFAKIARRVSLVLDAHLFCIMLWNEDNQLLEHSYSLKFGRQIDQQGGFPLGYGLSGHCGRDRRPIRVANVLEDARYVRYRHAEVEIRSELAVPLICDGRLIGVLDLESTELDAFTHEHEQVLMALASHIASALENARLYHQVRANERRLERDLSTARSIQEGLLPRSRPWLRGVEIGAAIAPARELSGDFYDFLPMGESRSAFVLGDVAGKGTAAALLGSVAVGILRGHALEHLGEPRAALAHMNDHLRRLELEHRFVALLFGLYDMTTGRILLSNAGIPAPLVVRGGVIESLDLPGMPLGGLAGHDYAQIELTLAPGELLVCFSDGVEEARDSDGEPFAAAGVEAVLRRHGGRSAQEVADELVVAAGRHGRGGQLIDDRTVVVLRGAAGRAS